MKPAWLFPLAAIYLFGFADSATSHLSANPLSLNLKLIAAGIITTIPLMLFAAACACRRSVSFSIWGRR
ncbi:DMT superfamily transporter [Plautia stali symbiont]|nr:DMT superfamily transporter [Plautia stali symbiont]